MVEVNQFGGRVIIAPQWSMYDQNVLSEDVYAQLMELKNENKVKVKTLLENELEKIELFKYARKVHFSKDWTPELINFARGHVIRTSDVAEKKHTLLANPFPKIFNHKEMYWVDFPDEAIVDVYTKINGYMLSASMVNDNVFVSTTGTIDSKYALYGKRLIENSPVAMHHLKHNLNTTLMFEVCADWDPHIVTETNGLHFLGFRSNIRLGDKSAFNDLWCSGYAETIGFNLSTQIIQMTFAEAKALSLTDKGEGFICVLPHTNYALKLKTPYYSILKILARGKNLQSAKARIKNDPILSATVWLQPLLNGLERYNFDLMDEKKRLECMRKILTTLGV